MAANAGLLGKATTVQADAPLTVYTVPSGATYAVVSVDMHNSTDTDMIISLAITTNATPSVANADFLETKTVIPARGGYARDCKCVSPNERVIVASSLPGLICRVSGIEQAV